MDSMVRGASLTRISRAHQPNPCSLVNCSLTDWVVFNLLLCTGQLLLALMVFRIDTVED